MAKKNIAIVGAGFSGMAAALDLVKAGHEVQIFEQDLEVGGLAGSFEVSPGHRLEKFYHHWFTSDTDIIDLIGELGLAHKLKYRGTNTGLYYANSVFRLASPFDLLKFTPIPLIDRVRTGLMALRARSITNWSKLEDQSAEEWIIRSGGRRAYETIWKPLLKGKFGMEAPNVSAVWFWNKLKLRGSSRDKKGGESLVYFDGGFGSVGEALKVALENRGVKFRLGTPVEQILVENGACKGLRCNGEDIAADKVLATVPLPIFLKITSALPESYRAIHSQIRFLGNVCLILRLKKSLSSTYWLNVADPNFPFVGVIEHTNFDPRENYGGEHIAYLSKYLPTSEEMFTMSESELFEYALPFVQRIFPEFSKEWVLGYKAWRAEYSQPVITKKYSKLIPDVQTPIANLWLSTMAQIYPEDRGTNYAVRHGRSVAARMRQ